MALPNTGGGFQTTDGNTSELVIGTQVDPQTATTTATLTAAQITGGLLVGSPGTGAASYTLPTVASVFAIMNNMKVNSTFSLGIVNLGTSSGVITIVTNTGWTLVGNVAIAISSGLRCTIRKTGDATATLYIGV